MNIAQRLAPLTLIAATLAACFLVQSAVAATPVVQLEPVHITAQRVPAGPTPVVRLPRVEVTAARVQPRAAQVRHAMNPQVFSRVAERKNGVI